MSIPGTHPTGPGWYPDPAGGDGQRWHDGQGWTGQVMHGKPVRALGPGFARLADWLGRMLVVCGAFYLVQAVLFGLASLNPPDIAPQGGIAAAPPDQAQAGASAASALIMLGFGLVFLLTQVTWLVWQYQLAARAPVRLRRSPAGHVGWWFVPFASWVVPRGNIGDLWRAYGTQRRGERAEPTPAVFSIWWALWISPVVFLPLVVVAMVRSAMVQGGLGTVMGLMALMSLALAVAGFTARSVVRDLSWRALLHFADAR